VFSRFSILFLIQTTAVGKKMYTSAHTRTTTEGATFFLTASDKFIKKTWRSTRTLRSSQYSPIHKKTNSKSNVRYKASNSVLLRLCLLGAGSFHKDILRFFSNEQQQVWWHAQQARYRETRSHCSKIVEYYSSMASFDKNIVNTLEKSSETTKSLRNAR